MITTHLPYRPPYQWQAMLAFLEARAVPTTETVVAGVYRRTLRVAGGDGRSATGIVSVRHAASRQALAVKLSPSLADHAPTVLDRVAHLFDLGCEPAAMTPVLGELGHAEPGLRLPGAVDVFEIAVRAVLGQQVTIAAARTLATRVVARFGSPIGAADRDEPGRSISRAPGTGTEPSHLFPAAAALAAMQPAGLVASLGELGVVRVRGQAIAELARRVAEGSLPLAERPRLSPTRDEAEAAVAALCAIRGIGPWTAHYIAMRGFGWADAFPPGDVAALNALGATRPAEALAMAERWRPWRGYALMHLWRRAARLPKARAR